MMESIKKKLPGILTCFIIAVPSWLLGKTFPIIGGPVIAILAGMLITMVWKNKGNAETGIKWTSKIILQTAVVLLGFGMNLGVILQTGKQSLPIIVCTISTSLIIAWILRKVIHVPSNTSILVGVGSSICGGSAIAATAPVIDADDNEVAQAISVIFFFNVLAAIFFPILGKVIGFDTTSGGAFGIFAGTAINDTSSVTAAAAAWDGIHHSNTLDSATIVKLTRTLAIIPITLVLAFYRTRKEKHQSSSKVSLKKIFPFFILFFVLASVVTTVFNLPATITNPLKELSKFFIIMAMAAIGLNTDIVKLVKTGGKPIFMGLCCWVGIAAVSLLMQHLLGIW